jgi:mono/diheme cytochrome c family protein
VASRRVSLLLVVSAASGVASACGGGSAGTASEAAVSGQEVFAKAGCGGCHTLAAAGAHSTRGPSLDLMRPSLETVKHWVEKGGGGMPGFATTLSDAEIQAVSHFVAEQAGR